MLHGFAGNPVKGATDIISPRKRGHFGCRVQHGDLKNGASNRNSYRAASPRRRRLGEFLCRLVIPG
jgi:hypothetical protein